MNINKYLDKLNISFTVDDGIFTFTMYDGKIKKLTQKEIEQYLFIKLIELIENE